MSNLQKFIEIMKEEKEKLEGYVKSAEAEVLLTEELLSTRKGKLQTLVADLETVNTELAEAEEFAKSKNKAKTKTATKAQEKAVDAQEEAKE
jgi:hypothetical protein